MRILVAAFAVMFAFLSAAPSLAQSSVSIKLVGESGQHSRASVTLRSLYGATLVEGVRSARDDATVYSFALPETAWIGGFARLEVTVEGIQLPDGDAYAGRNIDVSFEVAVLDTTRSAKTEIEFPIIASSSRSAREAYASVGARQGDELNDGFFRMLQFLEVFRIDRAEDLRTEFGSAARRLVKSAADYSVRLSQAVDHSVWTEDSRYLIIPPESLGRKISFYLESVPEALNTHLAAYLDARVKLWKFAVAIPNVLAERDRGAACRNAVSILDHAQQVGTNYAFRFSAEENDLVRKKIAKEYETPGSFEVYVKARESDVRAKCRDT